MWDTIWTQFQASTGWDTRHGQQTLGRAISHNLATRGQLVGEAPTGVGKSIAALLPTIAAVEKHGHRTMLTTETLSLLDQIVDKDLPMLWNIFRNFTFFGLKGRNHYLCINKAGTYNDIVQKVQGRLDGTNGERRDVERILGYRLDDDEWSDISGDTDFCSSNQCAPDRCYSAKARELALKADIVVTSHRMLQVHAEFVKDSGEAEGLLGVFHHIIVDEAHSLEQVVIDGSTLEINPWDLSKKFNNIIKATDALSKYHGRAEHLEKRVKTAVNIIKEFFMHQAGYIQSVDDWSSESYLISQKIVMTNDTEYLEAMELYETHLPLLATDIVNETTDLIKEFTKELESLEKGKGKVRKGISSLSYLGSLFGLIGNAVSTKEGTVSAYGTTYALFADGLKSRDISNREVKGIRIRSVPLDVSRFLKEFWTYTNSVTLISATLKDHSENSFRFLKRSLGLNKDATEVVVESPFSFETQQLLYVTDGNYEPDYDLRGSQFDLTELRRLIDASQGRTLVLFTAMKELQYVADAFRRDSSFKYDLLVQESGADKSVLAEKFKENISSVMLGSRSFFQGFDVQGESLTTVIQVKYPNPRYDATMRSCIAYWRSQGFPNYYLMKSQELFLQAAGRGVRSADCKAVCALLDKRAADPSHNIRQSVDQMSARAYTGSEMTSSVDRVAQWLVS